MFGVLGSGIVRQDAGGGAGGLGGGGQASDMGRGRSIRQGG